MQILWHYWPLFQNWAKFLLTLCLSVILMSVNMLTLSFCRMPWHPSSKRFLATDKEQNQTKSRSYKTSFDVNYGHTCFYNVLGSIEFKTPSITALSLNGLNVTCRISVECGYAQCHVISGLYYKCFTIIIYDHNDSGQHYKTTITIVIDDPS